jgi:histone chaperone ASF1
LEWKIVYVGSAEDSTHDQTLEEVMVGPVTAGVSQFVLQAAAPDHNTIPIQDLIGVTVVLVTCSYMDQEFARIGYYVNNEYSEPYEEGTVPNPFVISKLYRNILAAEPRVTRFAINWSGANGPALEAAEGDAAVAADDDEGMDLNDMEDGDEEDEDDSEDGDEEEGDIDLAEEEGAVDQGNEEDNVQSVVVNDNGNVNDNNDDQGNVFLAPGQQVMMQEDSNSMDVARMQARAPLF